MANEANRPATARAGYINDSLAYAMSAEVHGHFLGIVEQCSKHQLGGLGIDGEPPG